MYAGEFEAINSEVSRLELPDGWLIVTRIHLIVAGKDYQAVSQPLIYHDPDKKWRIEK